MVAGGGEGGAAENKEVEDELRRCEGLVTNASICFSKTNPRRCSALVTLLRFFNGTKI